MTRARVDNDSRPTGEIIDGLCDEVCADGAAEARADSLPQASASEAAREARPHSAVASDRLRA
jgi:hypothetical protein